MLTSAVESLSTNETAKAMIKWVEDLNKKTKSLWNSSKYFRIISIVTGSITISWTARNIYLKYYRKYYNMAPGPYGIPLIGQSMDLIYPDNLLNLGRDKCLISICLGPTMNVAFMNNPYLINRVWLDSRVLDNMNIVNNDDMFININGKEWSKRRRIVYSNLMSTMKSSFVENATKTFIKNKVFTVFDDKIKKNEKITVKPLFRPLGFNLVLHACFGKELETLDDPFWLKSDELTSKLSTDVVLQSMILLLCGGENKVSDFLQRIFGLMSFEQILADFRKLIEEFASNEKYNVKKDENNENNGDIKLFIDYINEYLSNNDKKNTLSKRHLFGDLSLMFIGATDTTYAGLAFAMVMAAKYPLIQQELFEELNNAFGTDINNITLSKGGILKIPKLRAFIHEILRIHPPAPTSQLREMNQNGFKIDTREFGGDGIYDVPKGCKLIINNLAIHHNPKWWIKNYDPENNEKHKNINMDEIHFEFWLDSNGKFNKLQNSELFLTFGRGKRDCVGQSLAMKEMYIVLSMIFMRYKVYGPNGDNNVNIKRITANVMEPSPGVITFVID